MQVSADQRNRTVASARGPSALAALSVYECDHDLARVMMPRPEIHLAVRFGPSARGGLDVHAFGARQKAHRKLIPSGHRMVTARLHLWAAETVLGVPASAVAGRIVALEDLWGQASLRPMLDRLAASHNLVEAAAVLEGAIAERLASVHPHRQRTQLALQAADRLRTANVNAVALDLGVSERHLRRVFRETVGVSPKGFAKLTRFHSALRAAREDRGASWASIAANVGYYDQAHLIAEFRAIAGVTPRALVTELRGSPPAD